jgi:hypothetical protein
MGLIFASAAAPPSDRRRRRLKASTVRADQPHMPDSIPPQDSASIIDAGIRQYLHSPQVVQAIRATLRHAISAHAPQVDREEIRAIVAEEVASALAGLRIVKEIGQ